MLILPFFYTFLKNDMQSTEYKYANTTYTKIEFRLRNV